MRTETACSSGSRRRSARRPTDLCWAAAAVAWLLTCGGGVASCGGEPRAARDGGEAPDAAEEASSEVEAASEAATECTSDAQCAAPTPFCIGGACASTRPLGNACASAPECASGHCANGVCCGTASCPACEACGSAGYCAPASSGALCATAHASASACDGHGACQETTCQAGYLDCDGNASNGCETAFSLPNCGACGTLCSPANVAVAVCPSSTGGCSYTTCIQGYLDCDGNKSNGCETPWSVSNCGGCGTLCQPDNAVGAVCSPSSGGCTYTSCAPFDSYGNLYLDCDGNKANGCESNPSADATCGPCSNPCGSNFFCGQKTVGGAYSCVHD